MPPFCAVRFASLCRPVVVGVSTPPGFVPSIRRMRGSGSAMRACVDARLRTFGGEKR
ncbi:hypothetical protein AERO8C_70671 [Aeromonas veronii]|uniref:Uncharacterized protein n=1 Tax=Aeromonas veronii TaxID=654 RepID=A0A653LDV7_AERVE|nr:hypothetical protein AERO8C_70671 [Aeromonas veronii]